MMPTTGDIVMSPFTDDALYNEQLNKTIFWQVCISMYVSGEYLDAHPGSQGLIDVDC